MIRTTTADRVARIAFDRPEKKNAITRDMYARLAAALRAADEDREVRVVILCGSRDCFTAGNDISDFLNRPPHAGDDWPTRRLFETLPAMQKPVIAAVGGLAVGIGVTMLLHCDLVYAAEETSFQMPFVPIGIVPEFGSTFLLPLIAGYARAAELLLLGQPFSAEKAREAGLVTAVVPKVRLFEEAGEAAARLAQLPPESIRITKRLMRRWQAETVKAAIAEEGRTVVERLQSPEAKEALTAFLEKRKPDFSRF